MRVATALVSMAVAWIPVALGGCAELEKEKPVRVLVEGPHSVPVGGTITLSASTENGEDRGYVWESTDEGLATVDAEGQVTALAAGDVMVHATGSTTGEVGEHPVTVVFDVDARVPHYSDWLGSAHNRADDEAFTHWDEEGEVEADCARCHSRGGFLDYLGADGTAAGAVDHPADLGTTIDCDTCHDPAAEALSSVTFPSGTEVDGLGAEARCMVCHQGRASTPDVDEEIAMAGLADEEGVVADEDAIGEELGFLNIHYYPAGATLFAGRVQGGYQYGDQVYDWRFRHAPGYETCIDCHDAHSLQVKVDACGSCHPGVETLEDLRDVRMIASATRDYDGDGDLSEGIAGEIDGLREALLAAITAYAGDQGNDAICYDAHAYPYFFQDGDNSGDCGDDEASFPNKYAQWSPRLLRAAFNYQMATKDPGAYAHNAKYAIQLLTDSIASLKAAGGERLDAIDVSGAVRGDEGHFNGAGEAARHWDEDEEISASCSRCHAGGVGLRAFVELGVSVPVETPDNGLDCAACHGSFGLPGDDGAYSALEIGLVSYPGGYEVEGEPEASNLCRTCHQGLVAGADIQGAIDEGGELSFMNVHYLPAASVQLGSEVGLGYEYTGKVYAAASKHEDINDCTSCHDPVETDHSFRTEDAYDAVCANCHRDQGSVPQIRVTRLLDYDGDGDTAEPLHDELDTLAAALLTRIQEAATLDGRDICYDAHAHPYFFVDGDGDGACGPGEASYLNGYDAWTPQLLSAAHNYQVSQKDPGAWAHNFDYVAQLLIDSIEDLGGSVVGLTRP